MTPIPMDIRRIFMTKYDDSYKEKIYMILYWAADKISFDTSFIDSCEQRLVDGKHLTEGQEIAIDNIIRKFKIRGKDDRNSKHQSS